MNDKIYYSWEELDLDVRWLGKAIVSSTFKPKRIVGIVRGGAIPAVMFSHMMDVPLTALNWSTRDYNSRDFGLWMNIVSDACGGTKTLVVEDIIDSGKTMQEMFKLASDYFSPTLWKSNLKVASLWYNTEQGFQADYYKNAINRNSDKRWVVFPYEIESCN